MDNKTRRDAGLPYIADAEVFQEMLPARRLIQRLNTMDALDFKGLIQTLQELLGGMGENSMINPPFFCDYGSHIFVGKNFFANYHCTILDVARVEIGDNVFLGPNVSIYTAGHPIHPDSRNSAYEYGLPVRVGNNVWIGGNTAVLPGVTIGDGAVIGAGSVVTRDVPAGVIAAGNPCRVLRQITEEDRRFYYRDRPFDDEAWQVVCEAQK